MSTRCQIGFYNTDNKNLLKPNALLYRHSDGYPGKVDGSKYGVLTDLVPFLRMFDERRGLNNEVEYAAGWTMYHLIACHVENGRKWAEECAAKGGYMPRTTDGKDCMSYGVCEDFHGDIEFYYAVTGTTLKVYRIVGMNYSNDFKVSNFDLIETVELGRTAV